MSASDEPGSPGEATASPRRASGGAGSGEPPGRTPMGERGRETNDRCIAVSVGGSLYGLRVEDVQEVIGMRPLTRVFHAPAAMAGITSLRGDVLAALDLGVLLGAERPTLSSAQEARIVVVREAHGAKRSAGLLVDALRGLRDLPEEGLAPPPSTAGHDARGMIVGVIPSPPPCAVLSVQALLDAPSLAELAGRVIETEVT